MKHEKNYYWLWLILTGLFFICLTQILWADNSPAGPKPGSKTISPALAASVPAAMAGLKAKTIFLIDVRLPIEFEQYNIPGSLNIAPHAIKTKAFLKSKPIVLVNEGFVLGQLALACEALNQAGFKATIMAGGLLAWKERGGALIGDSFAIQRLSVVTPQLLSQEADGAHHLIIDASGPKARPGNVQLPHAKTMRLMDNPKGPEQLKALFKSKSSDPFLSILISAGNGRENDRIQRQLAKAGIRQVYFLQDGWEAYTQFNNDRLLAGRPREDRKVTTGACKTCTQEEN
ncbi:MAG: rhodanese-like domain-containing protein [Desulfatitalea sp.]